MSDSQTCFMQGSGGTIFKMDVPTSAIAKERWDEAIAKGDLVPVEHAEPVTHADGSQHWVTVNASEQKSKTPKKSKKADEDPDFTDSVEPADSDD